MVQRKKNILKKNFIPSGAQIAFSVLEMRLGLEFYSELSNWMHNVTCKHSSRFFSIATFSNQDFHFNKFSISVQEQELIQFRFPNHGELKVCSCNAASLPCLQHSRLGLTLIGMREGTFHPLSFLDQIFVIWFFIKTFQTFLEVKIDINRVNLIPCQAL